MLLPITTCTICALGALSPEARCKTFDSTADGYGRGEAFGGVKSATSHAHGHPKFEASPCLSRSPLATASF